MLLEDCLPKKTFASIRNSVSRGELLHLSRTNEWYVHNSNPRLRVNCEKEQLKHVYFVYVKFLLAINDLNLRYDFFINKSEVLSTITSLTIGDEVEVRLENEVIPAAAVIRYIGPLDHGKVGTIFGVEILVGRYAYTCNNVLLPQLKYCKVTKQTYANIVLDV